MAHFAKLDENNIVTYVTVGRQEDDGKELELFERTGDVYKQTSYNTRGGVYYNSDNTVAADQSKAYRKNFAGPGYTYDEERDAFIPPKPYNSWTLNETTCEWDPPTPKPIPDEGVEMLYTWDEPTGSWKEVE